MTINVGRKTSGGIFAGLFGNPRKQKAADERYRAHFRKVKETLPRHVKWLVDRMREGATLHCPGCPPGAPGCHARIIEQEIKDLL